MSGKQQDAKLDMALSEVIKKVPKGDKKSKKRKSVDGVAAPDQAGKSPSKAKSKKTAVPNGTKKGKKGAGGAPQPSTSPAKGRRNRTGSATKKPAPNGGFQITFLQEGAPTAGGRVRAAKTAQQQNPSPQKQPKKDKRANAGLQVSPAIKKKKKKNSAQSPARKAKNNNGNNNNNNNNNQGQGKKKKKRASGGGAVAGGGVTLNQRFSALKSGRN